MRDSLKDLLKGKYFYISTLVFTIVWLFFFDNANVIEQWRVWRSCVEIEDQNEYYLDATLKVKEDRERLLGSDAALEAFGREKYFMKKEGETVFVLVDEDGNLMEEK